MKGIGLASGSRDAGATEWVRRTTRVGIWANVGLAVSLRGGGEFYEVRGELLSDGVHDWQSGPASRASVGTHYLFYFRDETFECDASGWNLEVVRDQACPRDTTEASNHEGR